MQNEAVLRELKSKWLANLAAYIQEESEQAAQHGGSRPSVKNSVKFETRHPKIKSELVEAAAAAAVSQSNEADL